MLGAYNHANREADVERHRTLDLLDVLGREHNAERFDVCEQVFDLAPTDDGEDVRCLLQQIRDRNCRAAPSTKLQGHNNSIRTGLDVGRADLRGNLLQYTCDLAFGLVALPVGVEGRPACFRVVLSAP